MDIEEIAGEVIDANDEETLDNDSEEIEDTDEDTNEDDGDESNDEESEGSDEDDLLGEEFLDKKIKVKVDGEERILTVRELQKIKQLEEASHSRMREAAEAKKMSNQLLALAKQDPRKFFEVTGHDPYEFAQATMLEKLEMMGMSEEQRRSMALEQENKTLKQRQEEIQRREQEQQLNAQVEQEYAKLTKEVDEAWADSGLPESDQFRSAIAQRMIADRNHKIQQAQEMGLDPSQIPETEFLTAKKAAEIVKGNWHHSLKQTLGKMDAEAILKILGDETVGAIKKVMVKRASTKASPSYSTGPGKKSTASPKNKAKQPLSESEYRDWQRKLETMSF